MNRQFRRVFTGTAVAHLVVIALFLVVQLFLMGARPLKMKEEITMIDLSGPAGGGGEPGPIAPPPPVPPKPLPKPDV